MTCSLSIQRTETKKQTNKQKAPPPQQQNNAQKVVNKTILILMEDNLECVIEFGSGGEFKCC